MPPSLFESAEQALTDGTWLTALSLWAVSLVPHAFPFLHFVFVFCAIVFWDTFLQDPRRSCSLHAGNYNTQLSVLDDHQCRKRTNFTLPSDKTCSESEP